MIGLSVTSGQSPSKFWKYSFTSEVFLLGWQILGLVSRCVSFLSLHSLSAIVIMIISLLLNFWFYWFSFKCIQLVFFCFFLWGVYFSLVSLDFFQRNQSTSQILSNHWRSTCKSLDAISSFEDFSKAFDIISIWSLQRNCYSYNDALSYLPNPSAWAGYDTRSIF